MTDSYHHGDLRNTLIQLGTVMLIESGAASLSLRKLAQKAGVSHNAPYQHFADKNALIAAIAEEGFRLLDEAMIAADDPAQDAETRLTALGRAYVTFALDYRGHLGVMFGAFASEDHPDLYARSQQTFLTLVRIISEIQEAGGLTTAQPAPDIALLAWSVVHGLSVIAIAEKIPADVQGTRTADVLADQFMRMIHAGIGH